MNPNDYPTKFNLLQTKHKQNLAIKGHQLLEKKKQALLMQLYNEKEKFAIITQVTARALEQAYTTLEAAYADSTPEAVERLRHTPDYSLAVSTAAIDAARFAWLAAKEALLVFAQAQARLHALRQHIRKTQKKARALANITIPQYEARIRYIQSQLEERERDERVRLILPCV